MLSRTLVAAALALVALAPAFVAPSAPAAAVAPVPDDVSDLLDAALARLEDAEAPTRASVTTWSPGGPVTAALDAAALAAALARLRALDDDLDSGRQVYYQSELPDLPIGGGSATTSTAQNDPLAPQTMGGTKKKGIGTPLIPMPWVGCAPLQLFIVTASLPDDEPPAIVLAANDALPAAGVIGNASGCGVENWVYPGAMLRSEDAEFTCANCARAMAQVWAYADPATVRVNTFQHARVRGEGHLSEVEACFDGWLCFRVTTFTGAGVLFFYDQSGAGISPLPCEPGTTTDVLCEVAI